MTSGTVDRPTTDRRPRPRAAAPGTTAFTCRPAVGAYGRPPAPVDAAGGCSRVTLSATESTLPRL